MKTVSISDARRMGAKPKPPEKPKAAPPDQSKEIAKALLKLGTLLSKQDPPKVENTISPQVEVQTWKEIKVQVSRGTDGRISELTMTKVS